MLLRHTLLYLPAQIGAPLVQFAMLLLWAHLLPPSEVGIATLVVAIQEITYAAIFMWWSHYVLRHLSRFRKDGDRRFLETEPVALAANIAVQIAVVGAVVFLYFHGSLSPTVAGIIIAYVATRSLNLYLSERARADVKIGLYTTMLLGAPALGLLLGFGSVALFGPTATSILGAFVVSQGLCLLFALARSDIFRSRPRLDMATLKGAIAFGVPVMMSALLAVIALNAPRFIVDATLGLAATGLFAVSYGLGLRASSFAVMLVTAGAYPLVVRMMETEGIAAAYRQLRSNILLVAFVVIPTALGLIAVNASVVSIVIPVAFRDVALVVLPLAALGGMLRYLRSHTTDQVFLLQARPIYSSMISLADLVLAVAGSYAGVRLFGVAGAVVGPLAAAAATLTVSFWIARRRFDFHFPASGFLRISAAGLLMLAAISPLPVTDNIFILAGHVALGGVIYLVASALLFQTVARAQFHALAARLQRLQSRRALKRSAE